MVHAVNGVPFDEDESEYRQRGWKNPGSAAGSVSRHEGYVEAAQ